MKRNVWLVDAFTTAPMKGNPAGVVPIANGLNAAQMQAIAGELHASETAFVVEVSDASADLRLRYFTPTTEVDLCGHATIGTICGLVANGRLETQEDDTGICRIETNVGVLPVRYGRSQSGVWAEMRQAEPQFRQVEIDTSTLSEALGIQSEDIDQLWPIGIAYTGLWDLFVPIASLEAMERMMPNMAQLSDLNDRLGVASTHVYHHRTIMATNDFHTRDFSPSLGIPEDPATGTATGALLALLHHHRRVHAERTYRFEQGFEIGRDSIILARVVEHDTGIEVYVGGQAVVSLEGTIRTSL